jgi:hypothetical protein
MVTCHTAYSKPVKQEVNSTVILPPLVFPGLAYLLLCTRNQHHHVTIFCGDLSRLSKKMSSLTWMTGPAPKVITLLTSDDDPTADASDFRGCLAGDNPLKGKNRF